MNLSDFTIDDFTEIDGGQSIGKVAVLLSMVNDEYDKKIIDAYKNEGYEAVITRAGLASGKIII